MIPSMLVEVGKPVTFSGYAEDYGRQIIEVQFSLDEGRSWTSFDVSRSDPDLWVYWTFTYTPMEPGSYRLIVRSVNIDGETSPLSDAAEFTAS